MSYQHQILGTVISSVLNYDQLCIDMGEKPAINNAVSSYVPCDGRSILGSRLEKRTGGTIKTAPDLRGKFVRGLNVMYSVEQPLPFDPDQYGDPQANRVVMDFQADQFKQHQHSYVSRFQEAESGSGFFGYGFESNSAPGTKGFDSSLANTGGGAVETRPKNIALYYYIKIN